MSPDDEKTVDLKHVAERLVPRPTLWRRIRWAVGDALAALTNRVLP